MVVVFGASCVVEDGWSRPSDKAVEPRMQPVQRHRLIRVPLQSQRHLLRPPISAHHQQQALCHSAAGQRFRRCLRHGSVPELPLHRRLRCLLRGGRVQNPQLLRHLRQRCPCHLRWLLPKVQLFYVYIRIYLRINQRVHIYGIG